VRSRSVKNRTHKKPHAQKTHVVGADIIRPHNIIHTAGGWYPPLQNDLDKYMIVLTRFNGNPILINDNFIETAEETPDTVLSMQNGHQYFVKEKLSEILEKIYAPQSGGSMEIGAAL
jgi:flagellar protein FlbD